MVEVLASGGRYDALVASFRVPVVPSRGRGSGVQVPFDGVAFERLLFLFLFLFLFVLL